MPPVYGLLWVRFPLISQRAGPLTASPKGEAALTEWLLQHKKGRAFALP